MRDFITINQSYSTIVQAALRGACANSVPASASRRGSCLSVAVSSWRRNLHLRPDRRQLSRELAAQPFGAAYTATLVLEAAPRAMVSPQLSRELLDSVGARIIVLKRTARGAFLRRPACRRRSTNSTTCAIRHSCRLWLRHGEPISPPTIASSQFSARRRWAARRIEVTMDEGPAKPRCISLPPAS